MNQFAERYKTFTNAQLIRIIDNQIEYQELAIEAAENELAKRQLTDDERESLRIGNEIIEHEKQIQNDKKWTFENKVDLWSEQKCCFKEFAAFSSLY